MLIWLGALVAPPLLFGVWMRIKLMFTDQGREFLGDREVERFNAEYDTPLYLREDQGKTRGKLARARKDVEAVGGAYGNDVASLLKTGHPLHRRLRRLFRRAGRHRRPLGVLSHQAKLRISFKRTNTRPEYLSA